AGEKRLHVITPCRSDLYVDVMGSSRACHRTVSPDASSSLLRELPPGSAFVASLRNAINASRSAWLVIRCNGILDPGTTYSGPSANRSATVSSVHTMSESLRASE